MLNRLIQRAEEEHRLEKAGLAALLAAPEAEEKLARAADRVRQNYVGNGIHLRGLIEFSNICRQNCMYCGLRRDNGNLARYRMSQEEIIGLAKKAKSNGYETVVLQSGEDPRFDVPYFTEILRGIKKLDLAITLSMGERSYEEYEAFREAGADRYLLRMETTDKALYERFDPDMGYGNRLRCLEDLKRLGYEVGTGTLVGLPGQTIGSLAEDILFYQEIDADMLGIGPLIPNPDTPLGDVPAGDFHITRRMVSLLRLLRPDANIPATTAVETLVKGGRKLMLASGANVVMPNVTEGDYRDRYALYPGKAGVQDSPEYCRERMADDILAMGRHIAKGKGFRNVVRK